MCFSTASRVHLEDIAHSLAEERATVLGSAAKSLTVLLKSVRVSSVGDQIAHSLAEERARFLGRRPNRFQSLAEERARFLGRRLNRSQSC